MKVTKIYQASFVVKSINVAPSITQKSKHLNCVTFDQNVKSAISAEFGILAAGLPDWWFLRTRDVIGTFGQTVRARIF